MRGRQGDSSSLFTSVDRNSSGDVAFYISLYIIYCISSLNTTMVGHIKYGEQYQGRCGSIVDPEHLARISLIWIILDLRGKCGPRDEAQPVTPDSGGHGTDER